MRRRTRTFRTVTAVLGVTLTTLLWPAEPASAEPECLTSSSDFDRDGTPDVAVGIPGGGGRNGAVQVRLSNKGAPFTSTVTGGPGFGTAVTSLSSYADEGDDALCSQLVVGSPRDSASTELRESGLVYVYYWNTRTRQFALRSIFGPQAQGVGGEAQSGAHFGAALAAEQRPADQSDPRPARLFVGAPGTDLGGFADTGQVLSFWIDADEDPSAHDTEIMQLGEPLTDEPTPGAALGSSLSVAGGKVAMGMPGFPARGLTGPGAGAVLIDDVDHDPDSALPTVLRQADSDIPGTSEPGDRFGAAVHLVPHAAGGPTLLVGAPGEDLGTTVDAGTVTITRLSAGTGEPVGAVRAVDQGSSGMAGSVEARDRFGAAVSSMRYGSGVAYLVGVPGEDVGRVRDAGMVQTIGNGRGWTQQTAGVPGTVEAGDRLGSSLGGAPATGATRPLVGVPGEDGSTGSVLVGLPVNGSSVTYLKGSHAGNRYGFAVAP